jgi:hypothetical protein
MSIQYFQKERGGVSPVGYEVPHIYKDPPKAIFTRKYEPVNVADVMYMVQSDNPRGDPTRINDAIQYFARGVNNMVEIDYGGHGAGSQNTSIHQNQAGSQFKVDVVRPPMYPVETLVALSRPHIHQNYSVATNKSNMTALNGGDNYDKNMVRNMTRPDMISGVVKSTPTLSQMLEFGPIVDQYSVKNKIIADKESGVLYTTPSLQFIGDGEESLRPQNVNQNKIKDTLLKELNTNFSTITIFDPKTNSAIDVTANIKDKNYIAIAAAKGQPITLNTNNGEKVKLKDYTYSVVKPNIGNTQLVIQVKQPDVVLDRNTPLYSMQSNVQDPLGYNEDLSRTGVDNIASKEKFTNRLTNFGKYEDRVSKAQNIRYQPLMSGSIKKTVLRP